MELSWQILLDLRFLPRYAQVIYYSFLKNLLIFNKICNVYVLNAVTFLYK